MEDVSEAAGHSSIKVNERHYYKQLPERQGQMFSDLEDRIIQSRSDRENKDSSKTSRENE